MRTAPSTEASVAHSRLSEAAGRPVGLYEPLDIAVFPWLGIDKPYRVTRFEFMPAPIAAHRHPRSADSLRSATSYFFDNYRVNDPFDPAAPTKLVSLEPSVVVLDNPEDVSDAYTATLAMFFAVLFDSSTHRYANGANFRQFHLSLSNDARKVHP